MPTLVASSGALAQATALAWAPHPSTAWSGTSKPRSWARGASTPETPKPPSAPAPSWTSISAAPRLRLERRARAVNGAASRSSPGNGTAFVTWGVEAVMLSAGTALSWLVDDVGILSSPAESAEVAGRCTDTGDVFFVPALIGLGTPNWDFGARTLLIGMTSGTGRPELVRAVLRGIAQRGADLLEAAEFDAGQTVARLRVDGGMAANPVFVQELADACQRPVEIAQEVEATSLGAGLMAGLAAGIWSTYEDVAALATPRSVVEPAGDDRRLRWKEAVTRSERWIPELSALKF